VPALVRRLLAGGAVFLLQWIVLGRLRIFDSYPDAVLLYLVWIGLREGRQVGCLAGFGLGFLMDAAYGTWGTHMLIKTLLGFVVGLFAVDERDALLIQPQQAFVGALVIALLHNGLLVALLALQTEASNATLIYALWLGSALYTAVVGTIASLFSAQQ
jgi:rod shape-determining protein MreD